MAKRTWQKPMTLIVASLVFVMSLAACNDSKKKPIPVGQKGKPAQNSALDDGNAGDKLTAETASDAFERELLAINNESASLAVGLDGAGDVIDGNEGSTLADGYKYDEEEKSGGIRITVKKRMEDNYDIRANGEPLITGASDLKNRYFTDAKNDVVIRRLIGRANQMIENEGLEFFNDSMELATRLFNVDVNANIHTREVQAMVEFADGDKNVKVLFGGYLSNRNKTPLQQVSRLTDHGQANDYGYKFNAYLTCIDASSECKNTVLVIEHVKNGEVCKRIFIVHRFGDAALLLSDYDYVNFNFYPNENQRSFVQYLANTVHMNRYILSCVYKSYVLRADQGDGTCESLQNTTTGAGKGFNGRIPYARVIGIRTWAAAYGAAFFDVFFREQLRGDRHRDVLHFNGPLLYSAQGPAYDEDIIVRSYLEDQNANFYFDTGMTFGEGIRSARLIHNNGLGAVKLEVNFHGMDAGRTYIDFQERLGETQDPENHELYPGQPRTAVNYEFISQRTTEQKSTATAEQAGTSGDVDETEAPPEG